MTMKRAGKAGIGLTAHRQSEVDSYSTVGVCATAPDSHICPKCGSEMIPWIHSDDDGPGYTKIAHCKCGHREKIEERHYYLGKNWQGETAWILKRGHEEKVQGGKE